MNFPFVRSEKNSWEFWSVRAPFIEQEGPSKMAVDTAKSSYSSNTSWIIGAFLVMNILIIAVSGYAVIHGEPKAPGWATEMHPMMVARDKTVAADSPLTNILINNWYRWDTGWYLKIASMGYAPGDNSTGFQPLYPFLIRVLNGFGINYLVAALIISRISCLAALLLLFKITVELYRSEETGRRTVLALLTFPAAFFLFAGYTEALALAFTLTCFYFIQKDKWFLAGITGGLVALTRIQGIVIVVPMLWLALSGPDHRYRTYNLSTSINAFMENKTYFGLNKIKNESWISIFSSLLPIISLGVYSLYLKLAGFETIAGAYTNRGTRVVMPWTGLWDLIQRLFQNHMALTDYIEIGIFFLFIVAFIIGLEELPLAYSLFTLAMLAIILMRVYEVGFFPGLMRYMLLIFPFFIVLGRKLRDNRVFLPMISISLIINLMMTWAFIRWYWVA